MSSDSDCERTGPAYFDRVDHRGKPIDIVVDERRHWRKSTRFRDPEVLSAESEESKAVVIEPSTRKMVVRETVHVAPEEVVPPSRTVLLRSRAVVVESDDLETTHDTERKSEADIAAASPVVARAHSVAVEGLQIGQPDSKFADTLAYRTGFVRSVDVNSLLETQPETANVELAVEVSGGTHAKRLDTFASTFHVVCFTAEQRWRRRKREVSIDADDIGDEEVWLKWGADHPEHDDPHPDTRVGFVKFPHRFESRRIAHLDRGSTSSSDTDATSSSSGSTTSGTHESDLETEEAEEIDREVVTDEQRWETYDWWQIQTNGRSAGVLMEVTNITKIEMDEQYRYECEIYYREVKKARGLINPNTGEVTLKHFFSVPDDSYPVVFLITERHWFGRKKDVAIASIRLDAREANATKGVTRQNTYFEKCAATAPLVNPEAPSAKLGTIALRWHSELRKEEAMDDLFCPRCGRLKMKENGKRAFCTCTAQQIRDSEKQEEAQRKAERDALEGQRQRREGADAAPEISAALPDGDDAASGYPEHADDLEYTKVSKTVFHDSCCVVM